MKVLLCTQHQHVASCVGREFMYDIAHDEDEVLSIMTHDNGGYDAVVAEDKLLKPTHYRRKNIRVPLIMLTVLEDWGHRSLLLEQGADVTIVLGRTNNPKYMDYTIDRRELFAKIRASVRAYQQQGTKLIKVGELSLDVGERQFYVRGKEFHFTPREYELMEFVFRHKGHICSPESIINAMYPVDKAPEFKIIQVFLCKIRRRLHNVGLDGMKYVQTCWGRGLRVPTNA